MEKVITVASRERLLSLDALDGLAERLNGLGLSRRKVVDWLTDTLYGWIEDGGVIHSGEGEEIEIYPGIVDDAHGEDGSGTWISQQRKRSSSPPKRRPRHSMLLRLRIYDAAFRIAFGQSIIADD